MDRHLLPTIKGAEGRRELHGDQPPDQTAGRGDRVDVEILLENENSIISNSNFFVPTGDSFIVEPVSFIISNEGVLVSVRSAEFRTFRETEKRLQMNYRSYSTGYHLFISLLEVRIDFDADLVELIAKAGRGALEGHQLREFDRQGGAAPHQRVAGIDHVAAREYLRPPARVLSGILRSNVSPTTSIRACS